MIRRAFLRFASFLKYRTNWQFWGLAVVITTGHSGVFFKTLWPTAEIDDNIPWRHSDESKVMTTQEIRAIVSKVKEAQAAGGDVSPLVPVLLEAVLTLFKDREELRVQVERLAKRQSAFGP